MEVVGLKVLETLPHVLLRLVDIDNHTIMVYMAAAWDTVSAAVILPSGSTFFKVEHIV